MIGAILCRVIYAKIHIRTTIKYVEIYHRYSWHSCSYCVNIIYCPALLLYFKNHVPILSFTSKQLQVIFQLWFFQLWFQLRYYRKEKPKLWGGGKGWRYTFCKSLRILGLLIFNRGISIQAPYSNNAPSSISRKSSISFISKSLNNITVIFSYQEFIQVNLMSVRRHKKLNLLILLSNSIFINFYFKAFGIEIFLKIHWLTKFLWI